MNFNWGQKLAEIALLPNRGERKAKSDTYAKMLMADWRVNNKEAPEFLKEASQEDAVFRMLSLFLRTENILLLSGTGTGKTFMLLGLMDIVIYQGYLEYIKQAEGRPVIPFPCLYLVNASSVSQIEEVRDMYKNCKGKVFVMNYEQLRAKQSLASILVKFRKVKEHENQADEDALVVPEWNLDLIPSICIKDEVQKLKNPGSLQSRICLEYTNSVSDSPPTKRMLREIMASATPFVRPSESKSVTMAIRPPFNKANESNRLRLSNFTFWLKEEICGSRVKPEEYSPAAMERITDALEHFGNIVQVTDVKFRHKTMNKHILIDFANDEERIEYNNAYIEYIEELLRINRAEPGGMAALFVAMQKFRRKSEWLRRKHLARLAHEKAKSGKNVILATCFRDTQDAIKKELIEVYGYTEDQISIIRGGQSKSSRWDNVNRFQDEKSHIILVMLQAGGTGLSLHHHKSRNKRPRFIIMPPVWSIIEMLQMLGRGHRINSDSTTHQWVVWYRGTIEEAVSERLREKSLSMRELVRRKETWSELFVKESMKQNARVDDLHSLGLDDNEERGEEDEDDDDKKHDHFNIDEQIVAQNVVNDDSEETTVTA